MRSARGARVVRIAPLPVLERMGAAVVVELPVVAAAGVGVVLLSFMTLRALSAAVGAVCTSVPVSLRGTAFCVAVAASCGVTPIVVGAEAVPIGAGVCAETLLSGKASTAARGIDLM